MAIVRNLKVSAAERVLRHDAERKVEAERKAALPPKEDLGIGVRVMGSMLEFCDHRMSKRQAKLVKVNARFEALKVERREAAVKSAAEKAAKEAEKAAKAAEAAEAEKPEEK